LHNRKYATSSKETSGVILQAAEAKYRLVLLAGVWKVNNITTDELL